MINEFLAKASKRSRVGLSTDAGQWRRSSYCSNSACVEIQVDASARLVAVRDAKSTAASLTFDFDEWQAFVSGVKSGEFDLPAG